MRIAPFVAVGGWLIGTAAWSAEVQFDIVPTSGRVIDEAAAMVAPPPDTDFIDYAILAWISDPYIPQDDGNSAGLAAFGANVLTDSGVGQPGATIADPFTQLLPSSGWPLDDDLLQVGGSQDVAFNVMQVHLGVGLAGPVVVATGRINIQGLNLAERQVRVELSEPMAQLIRPVSDLSELRDLYPRVRPPQVSLAALAGGIIPGKTVHGFIIRAAMFDANGDGCVDMLDFAGPAGFIACMTGPREAAGFQPPSQACLNIHDADADGDVDLFDFVNGFLPAVTGPKGSAGCP